jgi:hypothetical protein
MFRNLNRILQSQGREGVHESGDLAAVDGILVRLGEVDDVDIIDLGRMIIRPGMGTIDGEGEMVARLSQRVTDLDGFGLVRGRENCEHVDLLGLDQERLAPFGTDINNYFENS